MVDPVTVIAVCKGIIVVMHCAEAIIERNPTLFEFKKPNIINPL